MAEPRQPQAFVSSARSLLRADADLLAPSNRGNGSTSWIAERVVIWMRYRVPTLEVCANRYAVRRASGTGQAARLIAAAILLSAVSGCSGRSGRPVSVSAGSAPAGCGQELVEGCGRWTWPDCLPSGRARVSRRSVAGC